jgi:hypothetical protein
MICVLTQSGFSAFLCACSWGHVDVARWLVEHAGADARSDRSDVRCRWRSRRGWCCSKHRDDAVRGQAGWTALLCACANGHLDVARWLVTDAGADVRSERTTVCVVAGMSASRCDTRNECGAARVRTCRLAPRPCWWRAPTVALKWRGGSLPRPAATCDRSERMSVGCHRDRRRSTGSQCRVRARGALTRCVLFGWLCCLIRTANQPSCLLVGAVASMSFGGSSKKSAAIRGRSGAMSVDCSLLLLCSVRASCVVDARCGTDGVHSAAVCVLPRSS